MIGEMAHQMALIPLAWLSWVEWTRHREIDSAWYWLAGAFFVSWIADSAADTLPASWRWLPSLVYPIAQVSIVGAVLLSRRAAWALLGALTCVGLAVAVSHGARGPDVLLRAASFGAVTAIVTYRRELPMRLRLALAVYFGLGLVLWLVYARWLTGPMWYGYQAARLAGLLLFCWAAVQPGIPLRLTRPSRRQLVERFA